ncbi:hypothetical protein QBC35DRAFT_64490 [Podospora australis]|uniref:CCZ1/INTU/HSP4 first Longin domain-containing protein n=1 Tax=Podospora australis TaxID=1536484 RepID=A0AAN6WZ95_9PEZI|nr:hypothetical protein QBC35DRAFT_64490 [Podospora australis]
MATTATASSGGGGGITPARMGFLAIYNPSLGSTDETIDDQIVYYASVHTQEQARQQRNRKKKSSVSSPVGERPTEGLSKEERNERLRQIGLAQGTVEFGRGFSGGRAVESIDTQGSRVLVHELEPGWWILASVDLTKISTTTTQQEDGGRGGTGTTEYSSREVKPTALLLQDLLRAHSVFLLHHASSLSALFVKTQRAKFVALLSRYWDLFLSTWNVMLHGNPVVNILGGIKVAACGELGIGVGEEERGSGEREVLEGLVERVEGLVDVVVGKFGEAEDEEEKTTETQEPWLGTGNETGGEDGAVFLGVGALSRHSLRAVMHWMEDMYSWGGNAYGVRDSPSATRLQPKRRRAGTRKASTKDGRQGKTTVGTLETPSPPVDTGNSSRSSPAAEAGKSIFGYLRMGYGTSWSLSGSSQTSATTPDVSPESTDQPSSAPDVPPPPRVSPPVNTGRYLIGLMGDVEDGIGADPDSPESPNQEEDAVDPNSRILVRTLTVELEKGDEDRPESKMTRDLGSHDTELAERGSIRSSIRSREGDKLADTNNTEFDSQDRNKTKKLRVVVYVNRPFIYVFLFELYTDTLAFDGLYKSLHTQLTPLHRPLLSSTAYRPENPDADDSSSRKRNSAQIFNLIWDPKDLTIHSTIPNIPEPVHGSSSSELAPWTRVEALNTHSQMLNVFINTREDALSEFERTSKTSRGWWIVWTRIVEYQYARATEEESLDTPTMERSSFDLPEQYRGDVSVGGSETPRGGGTGSVYVTVDKEIILLRKASDHGGGGLRAVSGSVTGGSGVGGGGGWADGASRLAQGIGVDTRRYIEGLLSLNR